MYFTLPQDDTSGDFREMLLALIGERAAPVPTADEIEEAEGEPELEEVEEEVLEVSMVLWACFVSPAVGRPKYSSI
jgi:hypothetical protein